MIDLSLFIDKTRPGLSTPWENGIYVYATNTVIIIRVLKDHGYSGDDYNESSVGKPSVQSLNKIFRDDLPYTPIASSDLDISLQSTVDSLEYKNHFDCPECNRAGEIKCVCATCQDEHKKVCEFCVGLGFVDIDSTSEKDLYRIKNEIHFRDLRFEYGLIKLISDTMKRVGGEWEVFVDGSQAPAKFRSIANGVHIAVMPLREKP